MNPLLIVKSQIKWAVATNHVVIEVATLDREIQALRSPGGDGIRRTRLTISGIIIYIYIYMYVFQYIYMYCTVCDCIYIYMLHMIFNCRHITRCMYCICTFNICVYIYMCVFASMQIYMICALYYCT